MAKLSKPAQRLGHCLQPSVHYLPPGVTEQT
jgi:hypothetical protein